MTRHRGFDDDYSRVNRDDEEKEKRKRRGCRNEVGGGITKKDRGIVLSGYEDEVFDADEERGVDTTYILTPSKYKRREDEG